MPSFQFAIPAKLLRKKGFVTPRFLQRYVCDGGLTIVFVCYCNKKLCIFLSNSENRDKNNFICQHILYTCFYVHNMCNMWSSKSSFTDQCILIFVGLMFGIFICQILSGSNGKSQINYMLQSEQLKIRNIYNRQFYEISDSLHDFLLS